MTHVELYDGQTWCGEGEQRDMVRQAALAESPTALTRATCRECLRAIYALGYAAKNALNALGPAPVPGKRLRGVGRCRECGGVPSVRCPKLSGTEQCVLCEPEAP